MTKPIINLIRDLISIAGVIFIFSFATFAQVGKGGIPVTLKELNQTVVLKSTMERYPIILPMINNYKEQQAVDSLSKTKGKIKSGYYGKALDLDLDLIHTRLPIIMDDGSRLWLYHIRSENSYALQFFFNVFKLPDGAKLFFYNEERDMILGAFTSENNHETESFFTQFIKGNSIYIEYCEPKNAKFEAELKISKAIHVFRNVYGVGSEWGTSGSCNIDVNCESGINWRNEIASVALVLSYNAADHYASWCCGSVINNTSNNGRPLFLTAKHCGDSSRIVEGIYIRRFDFTSWVFLFNHEDSICGNSGSVKLSTHSVYGANLLAQDGTGSTSSDYYLLELNASATDLASYGVVYAGWDARDNAATSSSSTVCIHHPSGDVKKISKDNDPPVSASYDHTQQVFWRTYWDEGVTEPVSSGSPLFNSSHRIIGQLYGGTSDCLYTDEPDYFGKLSVSWTRGNLAEWLDPTNNQLKYTDTYNPGDAGINDKLYGAAKSALFTVSPNPAEGHLRIHLNKYPADPFKIRIINSTGQVIQYFDIRQTEEFEIDLSDLPAGIYYLTIQNGHTLGTEKIIVK